MIFEEFAAVTVPSFWNAGFNVGIFSSGAAKGSSSASILSGSPFFWATSTGAISSAKSPVFDAFCARRYDSREKASCSSRVKWYLPTHSSAQLPMWVSLYGSHRPSLIIESTSVPLPIRRPVRPFSRRYGAFDMDSIPPATATSYSPAWMALPTSITARMPEPHTLWTVTQGTVFGTPAPSEACRAGACPIPAWRTLPKTTCSTSPGATPARASAALMATDPRAGAGSEESLPRNEPTGVRAAERITRFFIGGGFYRRRQSGLTWRIRASSPGAPSSPNSTS